MGTCRELIIIEGKCYEITNLGWNPKQLDFRVKKMCDGKDLRADFFYVKKNSTDRHAYTIDQLAKHYQLGTCENKLWKIIEEEYESFMVEAEWNKEFPDKDKIVFED